MCHQVVISRHACRGYLHKLSSRIRSWQKRWFVFDRSRGKRTFMYYSDKSESKARGGVYFQVRARPPGLPGSSAYSGSRFHLAERAIYTPRSSPIGHPPSGMLRQLVQT